VSWATTNTWTIAGLVRDAILAITPSYPYYQDKAWRYTDRVREFRTSSIRLFRLDHDMETHGQDPDGPWGDGIGYRYELHVVVPYGSVDMQKHEDIIGEDKRQIWLNVLDLITPTQNGIYDIKDLGWTTESFDPPVWGRHVLQVRYFATDAR